MNAELINSNKMDLYLLRWSVLLPPGNGEKVSACPRSVLQFACLLCDKATANADAEYMAVATM